jgi:hypothetical protein
VLAYCFCAAGDHDQRIVRTHKHEASMPSKKAASFSPQVKRRLAQIEQMTLQELAAFQSSMMSAIIKGTMTPKDGNAIARAVGHRLKVVEQELRARR